jgi:plasmid stabilization system protein ParE
MFEVRTGYLKHPCGSRMIYFRDNSDRIEIIRILHNKDAERHL